MLSRWRAALGSAPSKASAAAAQPGEEDEAGQSWRDVWVRSQDGLRLHARDYGPLDGRDQPVVCLPGLTRNAGDFHDLAEHLASRPRTPRRVLALDLRGRGLSDYDRDARNYSTRQEALDVLDVMAALGIEKSVVIGTSRGGLIAMAIAVMRPAALAGVVLNDIGPRIETQGLMRIISQLNRMPEPRSWDEATALLRSLFRDTFTDLSEEDWAAFARAAFRDDKGRPRPDFDMRIAKALDGEEIAEGLPELWPQFAALAHVPVLAIRGENSEIVSRETIERMAAIHPDFTAVTVPNRGHAPFLREPVAVQAIDDFLETLGERATAG